MSTVSAKVTVVNKRDEVVGKIVTAANREALVRKIGKLDSQGVLVAIQGWCDEE